MLPSSTCSSMLAVVLTVLLSPLTTVAQDSGEDAYYRAAYLQNEQHDYAAAAELFSQAAQSSDLAEELQQSAESRLIECREELVAADLANVMPPDSIAYVQLANIGDQATKLLEGFGLAGGQTHAGSSPRIPIEDGLSIPLDFQLSPALVRELGRVRGVGAALVNISEHGVPEGLVVAHLGNSDLLRGLAETGLQVLPPNQMLNGYPTFRIDADGVELWLVQTKRLLIFSNSRDLTVDAVSRLHDSASVARLSTSASFSSTAEKRSESLLFAWADAQRAAPIITRLMQQQLRGEELAIAQTLMGLNYLESATFTVGATEDGAQAEAAIHFTPDQRHLIYGLLQTAPIGREAFDLVPASSAGVVAIGLNPPAAVSDAEGAPNQVRRTVALMDIGRELFGNIESIALFAVPGSSQLPEAALVVKSRNGEKSQELWNQLLGLPAMFGVLPPQSKSQIEIGSRNAIQYQFPEAPPLVVAAPHDGALVVGTRGAVEAALNAADSGDSIAKHPQLGSLIDAATDTTSKAVFVSVAGAVECALPTMHPHERQEIRQASTVLRDTTVGFTVDEAPTALTVRLEVSGVPQVSQILETIARQHRGVYQARQRQNYPSAASVSVE